MILNITYLTTLANNTPPSENYHTVPGRHSAGNNEACLSNPKAVIKHRQLQAKHTSVLHNHFKDFQGLVFCTFRSDANFLVALFRRGEGAPTGCLVTKVTTKRPTAEARELTLPSGPSW